MTTIEEFSQRLAQARTGPGAVWRRADFHIHAPSSADYEDKSADAVAKLGQAIDRNELSFVVILQHQGFPTTSELDALSRHCPRTTLVPGAEINVLVDTLSKKVNKDHFFHCIVAVDPAQSGDYVLRKAKQTFTYRDGDYPAGFRSSILDLGKFFRKEGALFIPAHLHQSKAPESSRSIDDIYDDEAFLGFVRDGAFDALEVRQITTATFFDGSKKTTGGLPIPAAVCVASSDAHCSEHLDERRRRTWVRTEGSTFAELAAALSFRHRVALVEPPTAHARVVGLHVVGSFVADEWVRLSAGLNALIGSKGSGKTALLECLRFVLNTSVPAERRESVDRHVAHVLGSAGYVECLVETADGGRLLITRRADSRERIALLDGAGKSSVLGVTDEMPFPISILGWHEIEAVADKADARVALLDRIGDAGQVRTLYRQISALVETARDELPVLQRQVKKLDAALRDLRDLQDKRAALARLEEGELLTLQRHYEWFLATEQTLFALETSSRERAARVPDMLSSRLTLSLPPPDAELAKDDAVIASVSTVELALAEHHTAETGAVERLEASLAAVSASASAAAARLAGAFSGFREQVYTPRVNALPESDRDVLSKQIQVLEETKRLPLVEQQCEVLLGEVRALAGKLRQACDDIEAIRKRVISIREGWVAELNGELVGVRLRLLPSANRTASELFTQRYGADGTKVVGYLQTFGRSESYQNLRVLFDKLTGLQKEQDAWDISNVFWDVKLVELLDVFDQDDVEISLDVGKAGLVPIQNLSAGQRSVAVFPLLLRNSRGPLVIDQPEDNLDNRYIADIIAPDLLDRKRQQQYLVTSHNANLVVLTDADLIVHVDADGTRCSVQAAGFLSCSSSGVRDSVLSVLDGGEAALSARQRKYGTAASVSG